MSGYEALMVEVLARLKASGAGWFSADNIRRAHKTALPREKAQAIHLIDGVDEPEKGSKGLDCGRRLGAFTVALFVRSDLGLAAVDPFKIEVNRRLNPATAPYAEGVEVRPGRIKPSDEIADADASRVDMEFSCYYPAPEWGL